MRKEDKMERLYPAKKTAMEGKEKAEGREGQRGEMNREAQKSTGEMIPVLFPLFWFSLCVFIEGDEVGEGGEGGEGAGG
jgi:hypothetical protein